MKVYGFPMSTNTMRVTACLYEKDLDFDFIHIDMKSGQHKQQPHLSLNPFGQVPVFEDGDLTLFESRAITQYIAHKHKHKGTSTNLVCEDGKNMALNLVWMEVEAHHFSPVASKLAFELVYKKKLFGMETDPTVVQEFETKLGLVLEIYEAHLAKSKYLGCDYFTLVDLHHLPVIQVLMGTPARRLFDEKPHVSAWCANILGRPAWAKVVAAMQN